MKLFFLTYLLAYICLGKCLAFTPKLIVSGQDKEYRIENLSVALFDIAKTDPKKNILFYIHGRGKHPEKALEYLPDMEKRYNVKVLMFTWPSWINYVTRPVKEAKLAAKDLGVALNLLVEFKKENVSFFSRRKISFLSHSMGNIVFKNFIKKIYNKRAFPPNLFSTITMNAPDVSLLSHWKWFEKIDFSKHIYSTFNSDDRIMFGSKLIDYSRLRLFSGPRLGRTIHLGFKKSRLAKNTYYLNFSNLTKRGHSHHRSKKNDSPFLNLIFSILTNGKVLALNGKVGVKRIRGREIIF